MNTGISVLYSEFTAALTEVLAEHAVGPARRGRLPEHAQPSRSTPNTMNMNTFWRWRPHSHSGKPYKTLVAGICRAVP